MQQRRNGRQMILLGIIVVIVVLVLGVFLLNRGGGGSNQTAPTGTSPVVVAIQAIPAGTTFRAGQDLGVYFAVRNAPLNLVPTGAYTSVAQITSLIQSAGCPSTQTVACSGAVTAAQTIYQNEPVITGMFSALGQYRQAAGSSFAIPYGYVAIALAFDPVNSVLGAISPGDDIDVMASYHGQAIAGINAPPQTQYVMNDVRVVSVNAPPAATAASPSGSSTAAAPAGSTVVLLVRYQEALIIQHLRDFGWQVSAVLRSAKETDIPHFHTTPITDRWFFVKTQNPMIQYPGY